MTPFAIPAAVSRLWPILRPFLAVGAVLLALWLWGNSRFEAGKAKERAAWETEASRLRAVAAAEAVERVAAVNRATTADSERAAAVARLLAPINVKVTAYETSERGRTVCLDDAGRMLAREAIAAANASIAAGAGSRR